jgi:hypothetical protein
MGIVHITLLIFDSRKVRSIYFEGMHGGVGQQCGLRVVTWIVDCLIYM